VKLFNDTPEITHKSYEDVQYFWPLKKSKKHDGRTVTKQKGNAPTPICFFQSNHAAQDKYNELNMARSIPQPNIIKRAPRTSPELKLCWTLTFYDKRRTQNHEWIIIQFDATLKSYSVKPKSTRSTEHPRTEDESLRLISLGTTSALINEVQSPNIQPTEKKFTDPRINQWPRTPRGDRRNQTYSATDRVLVGIIPAEGRGCVEDYSTYLGWNRGGAAVQRSAEPASEPRGCDGDDGGEIGIGSRWDWGFRVSLVRMSYLVFRTICLCRVDETGDVLYPQADARKLRAPYSIRVSQAVCLYMGLDGLLGPLYFPP
jgi:hypothetical protein